jgi:hypothetical protein
VLFQAARYNFLSRSVRLGGKHNVRASILASSLSEVNLELHSYKGSSTTGPPSLVLHSSRFGANFLKCSLLNKLYFLFYFMHDLKIICISLLSSKETLFTKDTRKK